jgi:hypothetical protein
MLVLCFPFITHNAPHAAAVRVLLVVHFAFHYHLQARCMPPSGNRPHCSADGSIARVKFYFINICKTSQPNLSFLLLI